MQIFKRLFVLLLACLTASLVACGPGEGGTTAGTAPVITVQPLSASSDGSSATVLKVAATGGGLTYQWYKDDVLVASATEASYAATASGVYYVVVANSLGKATSEKATLTVSIDPVITLQPQSASVTAGKSAKFAVVATGSGLSYQWYRDSVALGGATSNTYQASVAGAYDVVVSSSRTGAKAVTSNKASLTVSAAAVAPAITGQPVSASVKAGSAAGLSVTATGTDLSYAWYRNGTLLASANGAVYSIEAATSLDAGTYFVVVTNSLGFVASQTATLTVSSVGGGSNTALVVAATNTFLDSLPTTLKGVAGSSTSSTTVLFADTAENAKAWTSVAGNRHGLRLNSTTLTAAQLSAADKLISAALSSAGATLMSEIRLSDDALLSSGDSSGVGSGLYSIALVGQPSLTAPWMLQLTGHQLAFNITYNASQVSATPMFIGAEPPNWTFSSSGAYNVRNTETSSGTPHAPLEAQRSAMASLAQAVQGDAIAAVTAKLSGSFTDLLMGPNAASDGKYKTVAYPGATAARGVLVGSLSTTQQAAVKTAVQAWVKTQAPDVAEVLLGAYLSDSALAATYVAYAPGSGGSADFSVYPNASGVPSATAGSYMRIDGPRVWIEFLVKSDGTLAGMVHYRSVWRDKLADYGGRF